MAAPRELVLEVVGLTKSYGAIKATDNVSLDVAAGEIHGIVGENGAGKSTLIGMIGGSVVPDSGHIVLRGVTHEALNPRMVAQLGISVVYQELSLCGNLTVAENVHLGNPPTRWGLFLDRHRMRQETAQLLDELGGRVNLDVPVERLPTADQQLTELARSLSHRVRLLILDEPTSSLTHEDFETLTTVIRRLTTTGVGVIFVSHRLSEILDLCDRVTVMRDGQSILTVPCTETSIEELAHHMVGASQPREAGNVPSIASQPTNPDGEVVLRVEGASRKGKFEDVDIYVRAGEIVGIAGLRGSGRHELAASIYGLDRFDTGRVSVGGPARKGRSSAYVPQDRKSQGLIHIWDVQRNLALGNLKLSSRWGVFRLRRLSNWARTVLLLLRVNPAEPALPIVSLSGGNQQKVVFGRALQNSPKLLLLLEPTRGVDVGAKSEIRQIIRETAMEGAGILVIESELEELLALSQRIYVMHRGRVVAEIDAGDASEQLITMLAAGGAVPQGSTKRQTT
jgi:ABC-type sugar transport system ATPase subunit